MKKYFFFAVAALVALTACSKIETVESTQQTPIAFSVMNHLQKTKATTGLEYPQSVPFGTLAWWTNDPWQAAVADQTYVFMDNEKISYNAATATDPAMWAPSVPYYWTKTGYITFASYSPYTQGNTATTDGFSAVPTYDVTKGFLFPNYTIVSTTDVDLMYANLAKDCSKTTNVDGTVVYDGTTGDAGTDHGYKGVPTIFNHALCQINFAFRAIGRMNPNVDRIVIELTDVDILNIDNKGSFTQTPEVTTPPTPSWSSDHTAYTDYDFAPSSALSLDLIENTAANIAATNNYTSLGVSRILLPQALGADDDPSDPTADPIATTTDQKLVVKYTIKTHYTNVATDESDPKYWATESVTSTVRLNNGTITNWLDNQNITYRISINPYTTDLITFDPAVVAWTDVYSADVNLNEND